jgi:hypothetical protein
MFGLGRSVKNAVNKMYHNIITDTEGREATFMKKKMFLGGRKKKK